MPKYTDLIQGDIDRVGALENQEIDLENSGGIADIEQFFATLGLSVNVKVNVHQYNICGEPLAVLGLINL